MAGRPRKQQTAESAPARPRKQSAVTATGRPRKQGANQESAGDVALALLDVPTGKRVARQLTLTELESRLWAAANALRGPVDPADFKTYVFPMLFWKWISDNWEYERVQARTKYGDELNDEIEADFHQFDLPESSRWAQVTNGTTNLGTKITKAFSRIEQANPKTLNGIFGDAVWANEDRLPVAALLGLIKAFTRRLWTRPPLPMTCSDKHTSTC